MVDVHFGRVDFHDELTHLSFQDATLEHLRESQPFGEFNIYLEQIQNFLKGGMHKDINDPLLISKITQDP